MAAPTTTEPLATTSLEITEQLRHRILHIEDPAEAMATIQAAHLTLLELQVEFSRPVDDEDGD